MTSSHSQAPSVPCSAPSGPCIQTPLPGPKTKALIEQDAQYISPSYTRGYPLAIERGEGAMVMDPDGNWFLDFCAGIAVCATGHSHPKVVDAIVEQTHKFIHMSGTDFYYPNMVELARKLDETSGCKSPMKTFFANSGTEAIEGALKLARYHTKRTGIIAFYRSFHGRTFGAMSVTASKSVQKSHFQPLVPAVFHSHYPNAYRPMFTHKGGEAEAEGCLKYLEDHIFKMLIKPEEVAGILVESIQGEGGYVVPPPNWLPGLRALCDKYGIMLIVDEVQAGMGRTGKMWAFEHDGIEPDIIACAKGIASGLPLGAIIAKASVMDWPPGTHATTFGGNPVACAASLATIELLENGLMANATEQGGRLLCQLQGLVNDFDCLGDVRGRGLMIGLEVVDSKTSKGKNAALRDTIVDTCFEKGLLLLGCGENTIRFSPPLIITAEHVDTAVTILRDAIQASI
jgi:4-aminobutyrate aminotransferase